jgi:hypothetical protein
MAIAVVEYYDLINLLVTKYQDLCMGSHLIEKARDYIKI